jgi:hypothetical protein
MCWCACANSFRSGTEEAARMADGARAREEVAGNEHDWRSAQAPGSFARAVDGHACRRERTRSSEARRRTRCGASTSRVTSGSAIERAAIR